MTFIIKRKYLSGLANWLATQKLNGPASRARTKFINLLADAIERADKERKDLIDEFGEKENGELKKVKGEKGDENYVIPDDQISTFNTEVGVVYDREAEITAPEIAPVLMIIKNLVLNTEEKIGPEYALQYDKWCEAFEKLEIN